MTLVPTREETPQVLRYAGMSGRRPASSSASTQSGMTAKDIFGMLRRHIWLIVISLIIFTGASVAGTAVWRYYRPSFDAMATIAVQPPRESFMDPTRNPLGNEQYIERLMMSQAQSIGSEKVYAEVANRIRGTQWFSERVAADVDVVFALSEEITVAPVPGTTFLKVSMRGTNKDDITQIVNTVVEVAIEETDVGQEEETLATIKELDRERDTLIRLRDANQERIQRLNSSGMGPTGAIEALSVLQAQAQVLISNLNEVGNDYISARQGLEMVTGRSDPELEEMPEVQFALQRSNAYLTLEQNVMQYEQQMAHISEKFAPNHPTYRRVKSLLDHARKQKEEKRKELIEREIDALKDIRQGAVAALQQQYLQIQNQLEEVRKQLKTHEELQASLEAAERQVGMAEDKLENIETKLLDLRLLMRRERILVQHRAATLPKEIAFPTYTIMVPLGVFLGLMFGLGLTFLLELTDTSIKAPSDVARKVELPMLGMIPHLDDVEEDIPDLRLAFMTNPDTIVSEAFRQIRTTLMFSGPIDQRRSLLVTSPMPEDGRTSVSLNVGHAMANGGRSVLVIDANFRQPVIRKLFPMCPDGGLSSCLSEQANWQDLTYEVEPNLHVMAAGPVPPNPAELLGSDKMRQLLTEFQGQFDQIIFDGAPCLVVSDSAVLSTVVDGVVLTVRAGVSTYGIVQRTRDMLSKLGTHIFGVVLNGVRVTAGGYLRKNYETFYEYRESAPQLASAPVAAPAAAPPAEDNDRDDLADLADLADDVNDFD